MTVTASGADVQALKIDVVRTLSRMGDVRALPILTDALRGDRKLAMAAEELPKSLHSPESIRAFLDVLADETISHPSSAAKALRRLATKADAAELARRLSDLQGQPLVEVLGLLQVLGSAEASPLVEAQTRDENAKVRAAAYGTLAAIGGPTTAATVARGLDDRSEAVRVSVVRALRTLGEKGAELATVPGIVDGVAKLSRDATREWARDRAVDLLVTIGGDEVYRALLDALDGGFADDAAVALTRLSDPRVYSALVRSFESNSDPDHRAHIVEAFAALGDARALERIFAALLAEPTRGQLWVTIIPPASDDAPGEGVRSPRKETVRWRGR